MRKLFTNKKIILRSGQVASGIARGAQELRIHSGRVWLTVEGIRHDYFLLAGDHFIAIPGRLTVVEAEQDASVEWRRAPVLPVFDGVRAALARITRRPGPARAAQAPLRGQPVCHEPRR